jgi:hypothetical protein
MSDEGVQIPQGIIAVTTYGDLTVETTQSLMQVQERLHALGLNNVSIRFVVSTLVDKARNEAVQHMLADANNGWLWFLDADMRFDGKLVDLMLSTAFKDCAWADIVGAYCQLRGEPFLPTIDTGTGTWEAQPSNQGPLEVIRTGSACVLIKRKVFETLTYPWYGVRSSGRPIDALLEVNNYARIKFDGAFPFAGAKWDQLVQCAREEAAEQHVKKLPTHATYNTVGEDSSLCDKAKGAGFRIVVQTNAVVGHVTRKIIMPADHVEAMEKIWKSERQAAGMLR